MISSNFQVSGLGYGNEISERMYGQKETSSSEDEDSDPKLSFPELKLQSSKKSPKLSKKKTNISPDKLVKDVNDNSPKKQKVEQTKQLKCYLMN